MRICFDHEINPEIVCLMTKSLELRGLPMVFVCLYFCVCVWMSLCSLAWPDHSCKLINCMRDVLFLGEFWGFGHSTLLKIDYLILLTLFHTVQKSIRLKDRENGLL